jgi:purine-binding chemotaxis protein CheW
MTQPRLAINWKEVHRRLEDVSRAVEAAAPPEEVRRVLETRARRLARPLEDGVLPQTREILVFSLAGARYGIDPGNALEVIALQNLVPVPCTPPSVLGVVNHRGRVLPVLDLRPALDLRGDGDPQEARVLVVKAAGMVFGLLTEAVAGVVSVSSSETGPGSAAPAARRQAFIQDVTHDLVAVLDLEILMQDPRMVVDEEVR